MQDNIPAYASIACKIGDCLELVSPILMRRKLMPSNRKMKLFISPIIYATVQSKAAFDLSECVEVLKHLAKSDSAVIYIIEESRENIIAEWTKE